MIFLLERKICETVEAALFGDMLRTRKAAGRTWGCVNRRPKRHVIAQTSLGLITQRILPFVRLFKYQFRGGTEPTATRQRSVTISIEVDAVLIF
jgi:hypothetical protein